MAQFSLLRLAPWIRLFLPLAIATVAAVWGVFTYMRPATPAAASAKAPIPSAIIERHKDNPADAGISVTGNQSAVFVNSNMHDVSIGN